MIPTIPNGFQSILTAFPSTATGSVGSLDESSLVWSLSDTTLATITPVTDGSHTAVLAVPSLTAKGTVTVTLNATSGSGANSLTASVDIPIGTVIATPPPATSITIGVGAPTPIPTAN